MELFVAALLVAVPFVYGASVIRKVKDRRPMSAWLRGRLEGREGPR